MATLYLDVETFGRADLPATGAHVYAADPTTEILLLVHALDDEPVSLLDFTDNPDLTRFRDLVEDPSVELVAHNAQFDRLILAGVLGLRPDLARWRCTMCQGLVHGLPASLEELGGVLKVPTPKQRIGRSLVNRFCKPAPRNHKADRYDRHSHPAEWAQFRSYAVDDIHAMRQLDKRLPTWNWRPEEYLFDQRVNDRGFAVDRDLVLAGVRSAAEAAVRNSERFQAIVARHPGYPDLEKPTQRGRMMAFLNAEFGLGLTDTTAGTFRALLKRGGLAPDAAEMLTLSVVANKPSTAKYAALALAIGPDGRHRGWAQFSGAARTRRWAGRIFQPHNLPGRDLPPADGIADFIEALSLGLEQDVFSDDEQTHYGSAALRGVVVAPEDRQLVVSDLSNIEGRCLAWLAGETWKLEAYRAYDRGEGPDLYVATAAELLGVPPGEVTPEQRQKIGKVPELAFGYQGGVGAAQRFAPGQMAGYWPVIQEVMAREHVEAARVNYAAWGRERSPDVDEVEWIASETVKLSWRAKHPAICDPYSGLWARCENAARSAMRKPNTDFPAGGHLTYRRVRRAGFEYLLCRMPSGGHLVYFEPRLGSDGKLSYMGKQSQQGETGFGTWTRIGTYGSKLVENACQSLARDILVAGLMDAESAGYEIVLHVHDEGVAETPVSPGFTEAGLSAHLAADRPWLKGLPLAAHGFVTNRYRKD